METAILYCWTWNVLLHPVHAQLFLLSQKSHSKSCIDHIQSSVIAFNLSLTSSKGIALTCISVFSLLSEAQSPDLCVCPAFNTLNLSLASHWPLLKSWTLNLLTLIWSSFQLHQYERAPICSLSKLGLPSALFWPLFKNWSNTCVSVYAPVL